MADFCWDCVKSLGVHPEKNDLRDLCDKGDVAQVLCEGCGFIYVDHLGKKVNAEDVPRQDFEKLVNDVWESVQLRDVKKGDTFRKVGEENPVYTALADAAETECAGFYSVDCAPVDGEEEGDEPEL